MNSGLRARPAVRVPAPQVPARATQPSRMQAKLPVSRRPAPLPGWARLSAKLHLQRSTVTGLDSDSTARFPRNQPPAQSAPQCLGNSLRRAGAPRNRAASCARNLAPSPARPRATSLQRSIPVGRDLVLLLLRLATKNSEGLVSPSSCSSEAVRTVCCQRQQKSGIGCAAFGFGLVGGASVGRHVHL
jgi:hypothetical protein